MGSDSHKKMNNAFDIYSYRKFNGFEPVNALSSYKGDILCMGTCDLTTIKPSNIPLFTWGQRLSEIYNIDYITRQAPISFLFERLLDYLNVHTPKIVCLVLPVYGEIVMLNGQTFALHDTSRRVLRFLRVKKILSDGEYLHLDEKVKKIILLEKKEKILINATYITKIKDFLLSRGIRFLWTFNGTLTANNFYREHVDDFPVDEHYVGWVSNLDVLPDSSMGINTQKMMFDTFYRKLKK